MQIVSEPAITQGAPGADLSALWREFLDVEARYDSINNLLEGGEISGDAADKMGYAIAEETGRIFNRILDADASDLLAIQVKLQAVLHMTGGLYGHAHSVLTKRWEPKVLADLERLTGRKLPRSEAAGYAYVEGEVA